ncbi:MAG: hypothetical protein FWG09_05925 [Synergistaceae bacterium]|nr:hypothetical protein [Synergistaceae bacterium]
MDSLLSAIEYFISMVTELTVLFVGVSMAVEFTLLYFPRDKINSWLTGKGIRGNIIGAMIGGLTPF